MHATRQDKHAQGSSAHAGKLRPRLSTTMPKMMQQRSRHTMGQDQCSNTGGGKNYMPGCFSRCVLRVSRNRREGSTACIRTCKEVISVPKNPGPLQMPPMSPGGWHTCSNRDLSVGKHRGRTMRFSHGKEGTSNPGRRLNNKGDICSRVTRMSAGNLEEAHRSVLKDQSPLRASS